MQNRFLESKSVGNKTTKYNPIEREIYLHFCVGAHDSIFLFVTATSMPTFLIACETIKAQFTRVAT